MRHPRPRTGRVPRRSGRSLGALVLLVAVGSAACNAGSGTTTSTSVSPQDCPFSGSSDPVEGGRAERAPVEVTGISTSKSGCVDGIQIDLDPVAGRWEVAYADGAIELGAGESRQIEGTPLVMTLHDTTYRPDPMSASVEVSTDGLDYVDEILVAPGPDGELLVVVGVQEELPFEVSTSNDPPHLSLELG
jgi:hypothetical protein